MLLQDGFATSVKRFVLALLVTNVMIRNKKIWCKITGRHKWDQDIMEISDSSLFHRVDCVRCGYAIDGAALKRVFNDMSPELQEAMRSKLL